jgi:hypothetical protein
VWGNYGVLEDLRGVTCDDNWSAAPGFVVLHLTRAPCHKEQSSHQETSKALTLIGGFHDGVNGCCGGTSCDRWLRSTIIVCEHVILGEYHRRDDWLDRKVTDIRESLPYQTRLASPQGSLIPLTPQEYLVVYCTKRPKCRAARPATPRQLLLFELVPTGYGRVSKPDTSRKFWRGLPP